MKMKIITKKHEITGDEIVMAVPADENERVGSHGTIDRNDGSNAVEAWNVPWYEKWWQLRLS